MSKFPLSDLPDPDGKPVKVFIMMAHTNAQTLASIALRWGRAVARDARDV